MSCECYHSQCPYHTFHTDTGEGPFCDEDECRATPQQLEEYAALRADYLQQLETPKSLEMPIPLIQTKLLVGMTVMHRQAGLGTVIDLSDSRGPTVMFFCLAPPLIVEAAALSIVSIPYAVQAEVHRMTVGFVPAHLDAFGTPLTEDAPVEVTQYAPLKAVVPDEGMQE